MKNSIKKFENLKETIEYVDRLVFPKSSVPIEIIASAQDDISKKTFPLSGKNTELFNREDLVASYRQIEKISNSSKHDIDMKISDQKYVVWKGSTANYLLLNAAHEVRHRAQYTLGALLNGREIVRLRKKLWTILRNDYYFIEYRRSYNFTEMDAIIISTLAELLKKKLTEKDLIKLIRCDNVDFLREKELI